MDLGTAMTGVEKSVKQLLKVVNLETFQEFLRLTR
jgi:hypothetical protein